MALKFRLRGLCETLIEQVHCPRCGVSSADGESVTTDLSRVTFEGIVVVCKCRNCTEVFVPERQRMGVVNRKKLHEAVEKDAKDTGEPVFAQARDVKFHVEQLNASKRDELH